jgi:uncharacterized repeat protein (TIGR03803 family)
MQVSNSISQVHRVVACGWTKILAASLLSAAAALTASAQTFVILHHFNGTDGELPSTLVQGLDGKFYGTTESGGANSSSLCGYAGQAGYCGTVFKISPPTGAFTRLYSFCSQPNCADGSTPTAGVVQGSDGNFYGTSGFGGANVSSTYCPGRCGTVFKITPEGTQTTLYSFCSLANCADGAGPQTGLVQGTDGNFYGTTAAGGGSSGNGTLFRITPNGTLNTLHVFALIEGSLPNTLVQGTDGAFYGTAISGGLNGSGTVFRLDVGLGPFVQPMLTFGKIGARVTILGTDLTGATAVSFNGTPATFTGGTTRIATSVPTGATSGTITVKLPTGTLTSNVAFTVLP